MIVRTLLEEPFVTENFNLRFWNSSSASAVRKDQNQLPIFFWKMQCKHELIESSNRVFQINLFTEIDLILLSEPTMILFFPAMALVRIFAFKRLH